MTGQLVLLNGATTTGKSSALDYLVQRAGFATVPKYTTRELRLSEPPGLAHAEETWIRNFCDVAYSSYGISYGVRTEEIATVLENANAALIVGNFDATNAVKRRFPNARAYWISRDFDESRITTELKARRELMDVAELRILRAREAEDQYARHASLFDAVISNNGDFAWLWRQLEGNLLRIGAEPETLYESTIDSGRGSEFNIVVASAWLEKRLFAEKPERLFDLNPRQFEEFIASLMADEGYDVELTPATRDGGYDILAVRRGLAVPQLCLVECKRYSPHRKVGVQPVRQLYGVMAKERASAALVVTTSQFTADAVAFRKDLAWQIGLRDYKALAEQLARYR